MGAHWGSQAIARTLFDVVPEKGVAKSLLLAADTDGDTPVHQLCNEHAEGAGGPLANLFLDSAGEEAVLEVLGARNLRGQTPVDVCKLSRRTPVLTIFDVWMATKNAQAQRKAANHSLAASPVKKMREVFQGIGSLTQQGRRDSEKNDL